MEVNHSEADGKLYIKVRWHTGEESLIDAQDLKADEPLRLANFLLKNLVDKLRSGYWNDWARKIAKKSIVPLEDFATCISMITPLTLMIYSSGKLEELEPRSRKRE